MERGHEGGPAVARQCAKTTMRGAYLDKGVNRSEAHLEQRMMALHELCVAGAAEPHAGVAVMLVARRL